MRCLNLCFIDFQGVMANLKLWSSSGVQLLLRCIIERCLIYIRQIRQFLCLHWKQNNTYSLPMSNVSSIVLIRVFKCNSGCGDGVVSMFSCYRSNTPVSESIPAKCGMFRLGNGIFVYILIVIIIKILLIKCNLLPLQKLLLLMMRALFLLYLTNKGPQ